MLNYIKQEANKTVTENGAATHVTTESDCLDLFATVGALRRACDGEIVSRFVRAFAENRDVAMKLLFFARDIRGGLGERRVFRVILRWLADNEPASVRKNLSLVAEYGRYDDLLCLFGTACEGDALALIRERLRADLEEMKTGGEVSLLAKWLPSVNASSAETVAKRIARYLGMQDRDYRRALVALRAHIRILENHLRERDYSFDYAKQPSRAMYKYRKAFLRNDGKRYEKFLDSVLRGEAKLHAEALMPYEIIAPCFHSDKAVTAKERKAMDVTWAALENFCGEENALAVVDGSGSMYGGTEPLPIAVALSLGLYFAERNRGAFRNHFITFSEKPRLVEIKGADLWEQVRYCTKYGEVANTNLQKVFELILSAAKKNSVPDEELPRRLYVISDMEFDECTEDASLTNFEYAKKLFAEAGYTLPEVVFWNVASRHRQQPVTKNEQGVALVSGCTPRLFSMAMSGELNPLAFMLEVIESERYAKIVA